MYYSNSYDSYHAQRSPIGFNPDRRIKCFLSNPTVYSFNLKNVHIGDLVELEDGRVIKKGQLLDSNKVPMNPPYSSISHIPAGGNLLFYQEPVAIGNFHTDITIGYEMVEKPLRFIIVMRYLSAGQTGGSYFGYTKVEPEGLIHVSQEKKYQWDINVQAVLLKELHYVITPLQ